MKRVIVLGVDGMDPNFVEQHWSALPNLRRLRDLGGLSRLATTTPPESPVAWSTFITGFDPNEHGVFDFVLRDPKTRQPVSSMGETLPPAHQLSVGPYLLPLSRARVRDFRQCRAFWELLADAGVPVTVIRMPTNYPPVRSGRALSGMGTPDLEGTFGTYTEYTDDPLLPDAVQVTIGNGRAILPVSGPPNTLRRDHAKPVLNLIADIDPEQPVMRCTIQDQRLILKQGEWSPWIRVRFPLVGPVASVAGMFRMYARELHPRLRIYRSPLNADPADPALPISQPSGYAKELCSRIGPFYTQGIEEDTSALRHGALTLEQYLEQVRIVSGERARLLDDALAHFSTGLLFFYFSEIDQNSHMLWGKHDDELVQTYRSVDRAIGKVLDEARGATIIVMSDHGFASFDFSVNLNTWLQQQGFGPDQAYAIGLNAVYVTRPDLIPTIESRLRDFKPVVASVTPVHSSSPYAPSLIVGYAPGYRASWETALGEAPPGVLHPNDDAWIADHCIDAAAVPGVLMATPRPRLENPRIKDVTVTVLRAFGVHPSNGMSGRAIY
jgi:hypothetical protein